MAPPFIARLDVANSISDKIFFKMYCSFQPIEIKGFQSKCVKMRCESVKLRSKCINCVKFCILLQRIYATMGKNSDSGAGRFDCICLRKKGKATRGGCNYCGSG